MRDILRKYQPSRLEDLTALNALYRPGPIQGGMLDDFIERKHGRKEVRYDLPELKPILEETYGVILYQEQVMQISSRLAGYSLGDADLLRRAMGKKKAEEMAKQRERFVSGGLANGFPQKKIEKIFDLMEQFAGYGFNKSHSAAYAYLAFATAYLKAHYPGGFHGGAAHFGNGQRCQSGEVHQRMPRDAHPGSAARRERERLELHARWRSHSLRPGRGEERRHNRHRSHPGGARGVWGASPRSTNFAKRST